MTRNRQPASRSGTDRHWLRGGLHPFSFTAAIFLSLWSLLWGLMLPPMFGELWGDPWLVFYVLLPLVGLLGLLGLRTTCRVGVDGIGLYRSKGSDPEMIRWESIHTIEIGVDVATFPLLELPILEDLGRARRLEPLVIYTDDQYCQRAVQLEELGRFSSARGRLKVMATVDALRSLAELDPAEHPSLEDLHAEIRELLKPPDDPPEAYVPRRAR